MIIRLQKNILLSRHTTFKIGGPAEYFFVAKSKKEIIRAVKWAKEKKLPFFILGNGSNVLAPDKGYKGIVIKIRNFPKQSRLQRDATGQAKFKDIYAEAGVKLKDLVDLSLNKSLTGLEWLAGIPGTVGGAVWGNARAFDFKISALIKSVEVLDVKTMKIKNFSRKDCRFSEKKSVFKKNKNLVILSAVFGLKKGNKKEIQKKIRKHLSLRKKKHPLNYPSAGSVFINKKGALPSSRLIEKAGLKGLKFGQARVSQKHAGFIINLGGAKAEDVLNLIKIVKRKVKNKFGIILKEEIKIIK